MVKVGVIADTHIPVVVPKLPRTVIEIFRGEGVSLILHAGDLVSQEVLDCLLEVAPVKAVRGNMDPYPLQEVLPIREVVQVEGVRIGLIHGWGAPHGLEERVMESFAQDRVQCIVFGHSHRPANRLIHGTLLFNPGTPTDTRFTSLKTLGVLEIVGDRVEGRHVTVP